MGERRSASAGGSGRRRHAARGVACAASYRNGVRTRRRGVGGRGGGAGGYARARKWISADIQLEVPRADADAWLVSGPEALDEYGESVAPEIRALTSALWPGALTVVVPASHRVPAFMRAGDGTVALRASASPVIQAIIRSCGCPLAVTSANTHGAPAPASFDDVERRVLAGVDVAVDAGTTRCRDASTIVAACDGKVSILREAAFASPGLSISMT